MAIASFTAGEAITAGQAVYVDSVGKLFKASGGSQTTASVAGIAVDTGSAGTLLRVNVDAPYYGYDNLVPGDKHFQSSTLVRSPLIPVGLKSSILMLTSLTCSMSVELLSHPVLRSSFRAPFRSTIRLVDIV